MEFQEITNVETNEKKYKIYNSLKFRWDCVSLEALELKKQLAFKKGLIGTNYKTKKTKKQIVFSYSYM